MPADFRKTSFEHAGRARRVFARGTGPGVVLMTEIPGITPGVLEFARVLADAGFTVELPDLIGDVGRPISAPYMARSMARACISREFDLLSTGRRSPITDWLRAFACDLHRRVGGPGVGAIGMCLTGNFALSLMLEPALLAPVLSQPSLPLALGKKRARDLHIGAADLEAVKVRLVSEDLSVLGLRFTADPLCPGARFTRLREELGDRFEGIEIDSSAGNVNGLSRRSHSVLTTDLVDEVGHPTRQARDRVIEFLRQRLSRSSA